MKETLELVDRLQAKLNETNTSKMVLENRAKTVKDQVALLLHQVLDLQAQAEEARATSMRVAELKAKLQATIA